MLTAYQCDLMIPIENRQRSKWHMLCPSQELLRWRSMCQAEQCNSFIGMTGEKHQSSFEPTCSRIPSTFAYSGRSSEAFAKKEF